MKGLGGKDDEAGAIAEATDGDAAGGISAHLTPDVQAGHHRRTRLAKETEIVEDYVELIADLIEQSGEARAVEIARRLGVTNATVNKMVARLQQMELVSTQPYRAIFLTDAGRRIAEASRRRHQIIVAFLLAVGVPEDTARADAEGIEHYCSDETLDAFRDFVEKQR
jgi:DtxR family manganese transport transcriptional regulator